MRTGELLTADDCAPSVSLRDDAISGAEGERRFPDMPRLVRRGLKADGLPLDCWELGVATGWG